MKITYSNTLKSKYRIMMALVILVVMFCASDTLLFGTNKNVYMQKIGQLIDMALVAILPVLSRLFGKRLLISRRQLTYVILMFLPIFVSSIFNMDLRPGVLFKLALVVLGWEMTVFFSFRDFCICLAKIVIFFAWCSVFLFTLFKIVPSAGYAGMPLDNFIDFHFTNFLVYIHPIYVINTFGISRNYGIFREPGVYQMFLIVAMLVLTHCADWKKKTTYFCMLGLVLALWQTQSTTGYLAFLVYVLYTLSYKGYFTNMRKVQIILAVIVFSFVVFIFALLFISDDIISWFSYFTKKFNRTTSSYFSFYARYSSVAANVLIWLRNPLFGTGLTGLDESFTQTTQNVFGISNGDNTDTLSTQFAMFGIIMGIVWIIAICRLSGRLGRDWFQKFLLCLLLAMLLMTENVNFSPIWNILIFYAVSLEKEREIDHTDYIAAERRKLFSEKAHRIY